MNDNLPSYKEAKQYFITKGYDPEELNQYTEIELRVLAKHQQEREQL